ncbi:MAG: acyltransferase [Myxococcota bacterium]|nr:acyltransferase [Myxococcota bacterium]
MPGRLESFFLRKTSTARLQLDALDGLRGAAVLIVVLSHLSNADLYLLPGLDLRGTGKSGVYLFFALSAFLLTKPLLRSEMDLRDPRGWVRYALRRVLRIFPLYWLVLFSNWAFAQWAPTRAMPSLTTDEFVGHLLLQQGKGVYWTIPVEVTYYLVLPWVALAYRALRLDLALVSCATAAAIGAALLAWPPAESAKDTLHLGVYLPIFLLGSYAAVVDARVERLAGQQTALRRIASALACAGLLGVAALSPAVGSAVFGEELPKDWTHRQFLAFGALWGAVVFGAVNGGAWLERVLASRPLRLIGVVSFSIYLWHVPVARSLVLAQLPSPWLISWAVLLVSIAVGMLSFALIEWPLTRSARVARWRRSVAGRQGP